MHERVPARAGGVGYTADPALGITLVYTAGGLVSGEGSQLTTLVGARPIIDSACKFHLELQGATYGGTHGDGRTCSILGTPSKSPPNSVPVIVLSTALASPLPWQCRSSVENRRGSLAEAATALACLRVATAILTRRGDLHLLDSRWAVEHVRIASPKRARHGSPRPVPPFRQRPGPVDPATPAASADPLIAPVHARQASTSKACSATSRDTWQVQRALGSESASTAQIVEAVAVPSWLELTQLSGVPRAGAGAPSRRPTTMPSTAPSRAAAPPMTTLAHESAFAGTMGRCAGTAAEEGAPAMRFTTAPSRTASSTGQSASAQRSPADRDPVHYGRFISYEG
jgi:hypothetical protein